MKMTNEQKHSIIQAILTFISSVLCAITADEDILENKGTAKRGPFVLISCRHLYLIHYTCCVFYPWSSMKSRSFFVFLQHGKYEI